MFNDHLVACNVDYIVMMFTFNSSGWKLYFDEQMEAIIFSISCKSKYRKNNLELKHDNK